MIPRHLPATRGDENLLADIDHDGGQILPRRLDAPDQGGRERRVAVIAIKRDIAGLGRIGDERAYPCLHLGEPLANIGRARPHGAREVAR